MHLFLENSLERSWKSVCECKNIERRGTTASYQSESMNTCIISLGCVNIWINSREPWVAGIPHAGVPDDSRSPSTDGWHPASVVILQNFPCFKMAFFDIWYFIWLKINSFCQSTNASNICGEGGLLAVSATFFSLIEHLSFTLPPPQKKT